MSTDQTAKFIFELQHKVADVRNKATGYSNKATEYEKYADEQRANAINLDAEADRWQKLLDFTVLMQANPAFAAEFTEAVAVMGSVNPFGDTPMPLAIAREDVDPETGRDYAEEDDVRRAIEREQEAEALADVRSAEDPYYTTKGGGEF